MISLNLSLNQNVTQILRVWFKPVTGTCSGSLGESSVLVDCQVRVFVYSGIIDWSSYRMYVNTITLSMCIGRLSRGIPFLLKHDCPFGRTPKGVRIPWIIIPSWHPPPGTTTALNYFIQLNCMGYPPDQNIFLQSLGGL